MGLASCCERCCRRGVRRSLWPLLALAASCTPLRPLDPADDAGGRDAARTMMDAFTTDAPVPPGADTFIATMDAATSDAPADDTPASDARSEDSSVIARSDSGRDAAMPDARPDAPVAPSDLVAWFPFDTTRDATGNGHDLTNVGVTFAGRIGTFDTADRLWTASAPDFSEIVGVTMWVRPSMGGGGPGTRATIIDRDGHLDIFQRLSGSLRCTWGGGAAIASGSRTLASGTWTHVACVFGAGQLTLYVGGSVDTTAAAGASTPPPTGNLQVGQACCAGADAFAGDLSDVRLWRRAPSAMEISALAADPP